MEKIICTDCGNAYDPSLPHYCPNGGDNFDKSTESWRLKKRMAKLESETENNVVENNQSISVKYNKLSITGFILSIISIFGLGLAGIVGFILGIVALTQIKHTEERGRGLAIAAIIIGFIWSFGVGILKRLAEAGY